MPRLVAVLGAAALLLVVWSVAAPRPAQAFIGESLVIDGAGKLTSAAETIIKSPTFLTDNVGEAAAFGGAEEASRAAGVFEGAGILPALGSVLAFGAGTVIGSEICHVIGIEGCWYFGSEGADPFVGQPYWQWEFVRSMSWGGPAPPEYSWVGKLSGVVRGEFIKGVGGVPGGCSSVVDGIQGADQYLLSTATETVCGAAGAHRALAVRYSMTNRTLEYHSSDDPGIPNYSYTAPEKWGEQFAGRIKGHEGDAAARVGQHVASRIPGSGVSDPYAGVTIPSCEGETSAGCVKTLEELGLAVEEKYLDWQTAVLPEDLDLADPVESLEQAAQRVQQLSPKPGTSVKAGSTVVVTANPDVEEMPIVLPLDPAPGESPDQWREHRLEPMAPGVTVVPVPLGESSLDPRYDPETVVRPAQEPGTRLDPATTTEVKVRTNPADAPPASLPGGGASCEATVPAVDLGPLNQPLGSKFPFGIVAFFVGWVGEWEFGEPLPPEWSVTFLPEGAFGSENGLVADIDLQFLAPLVNVVRVVFLFASFVGLLWFLATAAAKIQGDGS